MSRINFLIVFLSLALLFGCKVKKEVVRTETADPIEVVEETVKSEGQEIIHSPGTINQQQLDSVKAAKMLNKLKK